MKAMFLSEASTSLSTKLMVPAWMKAWHAFAEKALAANPTLA
jgi:hypothetical protein